MKRRSFPYSLTISLALHGAVLWAAWCCPVVREAIVRPPSSSGGCSSGTFAVANCETDDAPPGRMEDPLPSIRPATHTPAEAQCHITDSSLVPSELDTSGANPVIVGRPEPQSWTVIGMGPGTSMAFPHGSEGRVARPILASAAGGGNGLAQGAGTGSGSGRGVGNGSGMATGSGAGTGTGTGDGVGDGAGGLRPGFGKPAYPDESRRRGEEGTVLLAVEILPDGRHGRIEILTSSGHCRLDRAAINAFRHALYVPARLGDRPIASIKQFSIRFRLEDPA